MNCTLNVKIFGWNKLLFISFHFNSPTKHCSVPSNKLCYSFLLTLKKFNMKENVIQLRCAGVLTAYYLYMSLTVFFRGASYGKSCYRLQTKNGNFIYIKTCGYLELSENNENFQSLICINSLVP
jgi:hypothetical protein